MTGIIEKLKKNEMAKNIFLLMLACIYIVSPFDVIPEEYCSGILPYLDDILVFILACVKSYDMGKKNL